MIDRKSFFLAVFFILSCGISAFAQEDLNSILQQAQYHVRNKNIDNALGLALEGLSKAQQTDNIKFQRDFDFLLGELYLTNRNYAKSIEHYINIIYPEELENSGVGNLAEAYYLLGQVYTRMGAYGEADRSYNVAYDHFVTLGNNNGRIKVTNANGHNHFLARNYEKSVGSYRILIDSLNDLTFNREVKRIYYEGMLGSLIRIEDYDTGIKYGELYEGLRGDTFDKSTVIWDHLNTLFREKKRNAEAIRYGEMAVESDPGNIDFLKNLAVTYSSNKDFGKANGLISRAKRISDASGNQADRMMTFNFMGEIAVDQGDYKDAIENLERAEEIGTSEDFIIQLEKTYNLLVSAHDGKNYAAKAKKYQFLLKDLLPKIEQLEKEFFQTIEQTDNLASNFEKKTRLELAELQRQKLAVDQAILLSEQEQQKVQLLQQQQLIQEQQIARQQLEAVGIQQRLEITRQQLEVQKREAELEGLQQEAELRKLRELENQQELELARKEKTILEQQSELQQSQISAARQRQTLFIIIISMSIAALIASIVFILRLKRSQKVISNQNKDLEIQQYELQQAQIELTKMLDKEQKTRISLQQSNKDLKAAQSQLIHAEKMSSLGALTAGIVHEINNPVNFVKGGIETLNRTMTEILSFLEKVQKLDKDKKKLTQASFDELKKSLIEELQFANEVVPQIMKDMAFGTERIEDIVNGLRIFSRQEEAKVKSVSLHETIESALLILRPKAKKIEGIEKDLDESIGEIECFPGQLNQVIVNLVSNAIDAVGPDGKIVVQTQDLGDVVSIKVRDNGSGIPKEVMDHIFEPFYTTKEAGKGTGLGLSISYSIIEKHNGELKVSSEVGKGTEFTIILKKSITDLVQDEKEIEVTQ